MRALLSVTCGSLLLAGPVFAQDIDSAGIVYAGGSPEMVVLLDGEEIHPAEGDTIRVPSGMRILEHIMGDRYLWSVRRTADTLLLSPGQVVAFSISTGTEHLVWTQPEGAEVYSEERLLGVTPFRFQASDTSGAVLTVRLAGYRQEVIRPFRSVERVFLLPETGNVSLGPGVVRDISPSIKNRTWTVLSAVAMVGSSVAAAYLKEKANRSLDEYHRTGSPDALNQVRIYDNYSAVAVATLVISFTGFAFSLTTD